MSANGGQVYKTAAVGNGVRHQYMEKMTNRPDGHFLLKYTVCQLWDGVSSGTSGSAGEDSRAFRAHRRL